MSNGGTNDKTRRWDLNQGNGCKADKCYAEISVLPDGEFILASDHDAVVAEKDAELARLRASEQRLLVALKGIESRPMPLDGIAALSMIHAAREALAEWEKGNG